MDEEERGKNVVVINVPGLEEVQNIPSVGLMYWLRERFITLKKINHSGNCK
jgi:hypothetical protein